MAKTKIGKGKRPKAQPKKAAPLKQPPLKGMSKVRNAKLDRYAEAVGQHRDAINEATHEIKGYRASALKEMVEKKLHFWSHGGVDFIVTPGEPILKIKTHKAGSSETGESEPEEGQEGAEDEPSAPESDELGPDDVAEPESAEEPLEAF